MQLMHMLNCLYASNCSGVWKYSSSKGFSTFRMIHGFDFPSFTRKSEVSTTRSRRMGKFFMGSTRMGPGAQSERNVAHVNLGTPLTIIPQLPQTPMRQDQRKDSDPSRWSLM